VKGFVRDDVDSPFTEGILIYLSRLRSLFFEVRKRILSQSQGCF
jgi:hypothetical protein